MTAKVIWRPEPLTARLIAAAPPSAAEFGRLAHAKATTASKRVAAGIRVSGGPTTFTVGSDSPLGPLFEFGTGAHDITPRGRALRMADGRWVTGPVRHPGMASKPFLRPLLPLWGSLYRRSAAGAFRGF